MITFRKNPPLNKQEVYALYTDANWTNYTDDLDKLMTALHCSATIWTAWENEQLIGLIRCISDQTTIVYIQDLLVLKKYQRQGIGKQLLYLLLEDYSDVRQKVLLTADEPQTRKFYEHCQFLSADQGILVAFTNE